jgi:hypothetical protein
MKRILVSLVIFLFPATTVTLAQVSTASLTGLVTDPSGAAMPGVTVTLTFEATNIVNSTTTDQTGYYTFPSVAVGEYQITADITGFNRTAREFKLDTGQRARVDLPMTVGSEKTSVTVEAIAPQLSTQDATVGAVIDNNFITQFPLLLRGWDDLTILVAGVQGLRQTDQAGAANSSRAGQFNVHGVRSLQNNFLLDGLDNNSISENVQELSTQVVRPSVDAIQEFKIETNPYSAELGRQPGSAISVTTKGGTNKFHGVIYEYLRNRVFDATDFFTNRNGLIKPQNIQNQYGGNIGGPVIKNKLFFFSDWEGTRIQRQLSRIATAPLANERAGIFTTAASGAAKITYPVIFDPTNKAPFPNNTIPGNRLDTSAQKIWSQIPLPTDPSRQVDNFFANQPFTDNSDRFNQRIDWQPTSKDAIFVRYSWSTRIRLIPGTFNGVADGTTSANFGNQNLTGNGVGVGWTRPVTPRIVNELRIGFNRNFSHRQQIPFGQNCNSDYIPGIPCVKQADGGISPITFAGFNTILGSPRFQPGFQATTQFQWADTVSWTHGAHQFKFGVDIRGPLRNTFFDVPNVKGQVVFDKIFTCQRNSASQCVAGTGISYGDFDLGQVQTAGLTNYYVVDQRIHMYSFFLQDDFKVTRKLTLNLGLRYDYAPSALEGRNRMTNFNPAGAGSLVFAKDGSIENRTLVNADKNNWGPRGGLAYQVANNTVLRMGYGIFYSLLDRIGSEDQLALNLPNLIDVTIALPSTAPAPVFILQNGFPSNLLDTTNPNLTQLVRVRSINQNDPKPYVQQWSAGFQQVLPAGLFVDLDYVGTKTTRLNTLRNLNQPISTIINGVQQATTVLPYPAFNQIEYMDAGGNSIYHGLDATLERRFKSGLGFRIAYTWSKSIDNSVEQQGVGGSNAFGQDSRNAAAWRGPSDFDIPQRIIGSYIYDLPFGKGRKFANQGFLAHVLGGFQISGSAFRQSGRPITLFATTNDASIDHGLQHALPNIVGPPILPHSIDCWYYQSNSALCRALLPGQANFAVVPSPGVYGNAGRNILRGPGSIGTDFSLHRDFVFSESRELEFRWEVFNVANHPLFGLPVTNMSGTSAGAITTLAGDPRIMQFALRLKF